MHQPEVHYPEVGQRRPYLSLGDACAYEAGYLAYEPGKPPPPIKTPFADGWADAAAAADGSVEALPVGEVSDSSFGEFERAGGGL